MHTSAPTRPPRARCCGSWPGPTERHHLIRENRRLLQAERHRLHHEHHEAQRMLTEQRGLVARLAASGWICLGRAWRFVRGGLDGRLRRPARRAGRRDTARRAAARPLPRDSAGARHHGLGKPVGRDGRAGRDAGRRRSLRAADHALHVQVLEELVRGLGNRSARHVMTRADLLLVEILVHLAERYRMRAELPAAAEPPGDDDA